MIQFNLKIRWNQQTKLADFLNELTLMHFICNNSDITSTCFRSQLDGAIASRFDGHQWMSGTIDGLRVESKIFKMDKK